MYRPVQQQGNSVRAAFFGDKNYNTLQTVLVQDFQERNGSPLNEQQVGRLSKTLEHYIEQVYKLQGEKPIQTLNKEVLSATAKDFSQYMQRKEITKNTSPVKTVMDNSLFQETSQRFERLTQERNEVKALPPPMPDFRISLDEDGPLASEMFELAKKQREMEALRSAQHTNEMIRAEAGLQSRNMADSLFKTQQDAYNRNNELALVQRQYTTRPPPNADTSLAIMPDRRELLLAPVGSFDTMTMSPPPRDLGQATSNTTIVQPQFASPVKNDLPQNNVVREDSVVGYREIENNLFIYSADRDWLRNYKENRYSFTVNFDPTVNGQNFGTSLSTQQKFKNIVRIELVKAIMPGESVDVTVKRASGSQPFINTNYQDNILNFPYVVVRIEELENNTYGTDDLLNRSFGVLQYDAQWRSDETQIDCSRGYLAMIPKFLKCQKDYYPTPLSTLQKLTIDIRRPNGELISNSPDTYDVGGIIAATAGAFPTYPGFPFSIDVKNSTSLYDGLDGNGDPYNFYINTTTYFSKFEICPGDRIQFSGYRYNDDALNGPDGGALADFSKWINRREGHIVITTSYSTTVTNIIDGSNTVGYANFIIIQGRYKDPKTGSTELLPFGKDIGTILNSYAPSLISPCRVINLNKQLSLVFRIITREMDAMPQIRPDNNY